MRRPRSTWFCCALAAGALTARAQQDAGDAAEAGARPRTAERIVKVFGFEERLTNPRDLPEGWFRAQDDELVPRERPGFPIWNAGTLDYGVAFRGEGSVRLSLAGGSASLRLEPGEAPIFPLGEYAVRVMVRAEGLDAARPRLMVRALDPRGEPIPGSERVSLLEEPGEEWRLLEARLPGLFREAAFLQIDLELAQAREFAPATLGEHHVWVDDFEGSAWFDEVTVIQLPQVSLSTGSALGIVTRPAAPRLRAEIRDLAAEELSAVISVYDARRRLVDRVEREVTTGRVAWSWEPAVRDLGWYRAVIEVRSGGGLISAAACDFSWLDAPASAEPRYESGPRFSGAETSAVGAAWRPMGVELTELPPASPSDLAGAIRAMGASSVTLPIWERRLAASALPARVELLREHAGAARDAWIDTSFGLPTVPEELASALRIEAADVLGAVGSEGHVVEPFLSDAMDRLGTVSARWQLGASGGRAGRSRVGTALAGARERLGALVPGVELALGARLDEPAATLAGADGAVVELPAWMPTAPLGTALAPWRESGRRPTQYVIETLDTERHTERAVGADLARRTVELWRVATDTERPRFRAGVRDPWRIEPGERPSAFPTVVVPVWRALADRLDGRVFALEWELVRGVRCMAFVPSAGTPERGGLLAAWNETASPEAAELVATLGTGAVRVYDIFGNERSIEPTGSDDGARREHRIALGPEPLFVEGIDAELVLFLASIRLDPGEIQSIAGEHEHAVTVRNPWAGPVLGEVRVTEPGGYDEARQARDRTWEVTPRTMGFELQPGEETRLPLLISFSRATEAGIKPFVFDVHVVADRDYGWVRARTFADLTWNDVWVDLTFRPSGGGQDKDLIVEATITNTGERARSFEATAFAPGMPRLRASIGTLEPGQSVVRRFPFEHAYEALAGERVVVSLAEPDGPGRLTKAVEIPE